MERLDDCLVEQLGLNVSDITEGGLKELRKTFHLPLDYVAKLTGLTRAEIKAAEAGEGDNEDNIYYLHDMLVLHVYATIFLFQTHQWEKRQRQAQKVA